MSSIDVLGILEDVAGGDKDLHTTLLWNYIHKLEEDFEYEETSEEAHVIRVLEGYIMFLEASDTKEDFELFDEYDEYDEAKLTVDEANKIVENYMQAYFRRHSSRVNFDEIESVRKFENSIKGTDYAYGGFMSDDL